MTKLERGYAMREDKGRDLKTQAVLKRFSEPFPRGSLVILPVLKRFGNAIDWEVRVHAKNAVGPLRLTKETAAEVGAGQILVEAAESIRCQLQEKYPLFPTTSARPQA